jgi:hypothetical protein
MRDQNQLVSSGGEAMAQAGSQKPRERGWGLGKEPRAPRPEDLGYGKGQRGFRRLSPLVSRAWEPRGRDPGFPGLKTWLRKRGAGVLKAGYEFVIYLPYHAGSERLCVLGQKRPHRIWIAL